MALTPGIRLGVDEVVAKIGEGGMGQVFRARDTKLDRDVAIYVRPFSGPGGKKRVSTSGGIHRRWSRNGTELFFLAPDGRLTSARIVVKGQTIEPGVPVPLFPTRIVGGGGNLAGYRQQYDVAPDGRFLINVGLESDPPPIRLLSNWKPRE